MEQNNIRKITGLVAFIVGMFSYLLSWELVTNMFPSFNDLTVGLISIFISVFVTSTAMVSIREITG